MERARRTDFRIHPVRHEPYHNYNVQKFWNLDFPGTTPAVLGEGMACSGTFYRTVHDRMRNAWEQSIIFNAGVEHRV